MEVKLYAPRGGAKSFRGELLPPDENRNVRIRTHSGEEIFRREEVAPLKTYFDFGKMN